MVAFIEIRRVVAWNSPLPLFIILLLEAEDDQTPIRKSAESESRGREQRKNDSKQTHYHRAGPGLTSSEGDEEL